MTKQITILFGRMHNKTLQLAKYAKCLLMQNYTIHISTTLNFVDTYFIYFHYIYQVGTVFPLYKELFPLIFPLLNPHLINY